MRRISFLCIAVSSAVLALQARAADPIFQPEPASAYQPVSVHDWTGFYAGLHAGHAWGDFGVVTDPTTIGVIPVPGYTNSFDADSFLGGAQIGYNAQFGSVLAGIEADISWTDMSGDVVLDPAGGLPSVASGEVEWMGTVRGRIGLPMDRILPYVTAGVAFADVDATTTNVPIGAGGLPASLISASDGNTHIGWTIGAGVEAAFTERLSAKVEYLYADFGDEDYTFSGPAGSITAQGDFDAHILRAGLNYAFW